MKFVPLDKIKVGKPYIRVLIRNSGGRYIVKEQVHIVTKITKDYIDFHTDDMVIPYDYIDDYGKSWGLRSVV